MPESIQGSFTVDSRVEWNRTPFVVKTGDRLRLRASGTWWDAFIPCSADGYGAPWFYALKVLPRIPDNGRYFRLMGRIVADDQAPADDDIAATFVIGTDCAFEAKTDGRLFVFVNDHKGAYWNNWGSVTLTAER
jgi:hypothetical protein